MNTENVKTRFTLFITIGLITGLLISFVDNFAFEGEVSPIIIVLLLLLATVAFGAIYGGRGILISVLAWICIPSTHFIKHIFSLPDTIHPNTDISILKLAIFTFVVASVGHRIGTSVNRFFKDPVKLH